MESISPPFLTGSEVAALRDTTFALPRWVSPLSYRLHLLPYAPSTSCFRGIAEIECQLDVDAVLSDPALRSARALILHVLGLQIEEVTVAFATAAADADGGAAVNIHSVSEWAWFSESETIALCLPLTMECLASSVTIPSPPSGSGGLPASKNFFTGKPGIGECSDNCVASHSNADEASKFLPTSLPRRGGRGSFVIRLQYVGRMTTQDVVRGAYGLFRSERADSIPEDYQGYLATHLEPTNARRLFPCFDEPRLKAFFQLSVDFPVQYQVVSNTLSESEDVLPVAVEGTNPFATGDASNSDSPKFRPQATPTTSPEARRRASHSSTANDEVETPDGDGMSSKTSHPDDDRHDGSLWRRITFRPTPLLSTYLVGFATGKFHMLQQNTKRRGLLCRVLFPNRDHLNEGWYALDLLTKAVDFFESFFRVDLPLEKLDIVAVTDFSVLGMENWGMMTFMKDYLLVTETTPIERRQRIARLIGHEVAHQWYGNMISVRSWQQLWLKEGFCRYLEFLFVTHTFPHWSMWGEFITQILDDSLALDCRPDKTHPIESCSQEPRRVFDSFDVISYGKGASLLRMLASSIGEDRLEVAMQGLVKNFMHGSFDRDDFLNSLISAVESDCAKVELCKYLSQWAGVSNHPMILVHRERLPVAHPRTSSMASDGFVETPREALLTSQNGEASVPTGPLVPPGLSELSAQSTLGGNGLLGLQDISAKALDLSAVSSSSSCFLQTPRTGSSLSDRTRVSQFWMPDLTVGVLPHYMDTKQRQGVSSNGSDQASLHTRTVSDIVILSPETLGTHQHVHSGVATPRTRDFLWNIDEVFKRSNLTVPITVLDLVQGQSSVRRQVVLQNATTLVDSGGRTTGLTYFNYGGSGAYRVDYDTQTWLQIFEYSPFLSLQDRLVITMTLFRMRTVHIGKIFADEPNDRCTLLLEWLVHVSQQQRALVHSTLWKYLTEQIENLLYLLREHPCWSIFAEFVCSLYQQPAQLGMIGFHAEEKPVEFQSQGTLSKSTVMHVLQNLAVCKSPLVLSEATELCDWALAVVLDESGGLDGSMNPAAGCIHPSSASVSVSNHTGSIGTTPTHNHNGNASFSAPVPPAIHSTDTTPAASPLPVAMNSVLHGSSTVTSPPPTQTIQTAAVLQSRKFDVRLDSDVTKVTIALQTVVETGDAARWWRMASILAVILNLDIQSLVPASFISKYNLLPVAVETSEFEAKDSQTGHVRNRWINVLAPPVFAFDDAQALDFNVAAFRRFSMVSAPLAKAVLRNTKLITALLERRHSTPIAETLRNGLISYASLYCSNANVMALFRTVLLGTDVNSPADDPVSLDSDARVSTPPARTSAHSAASASPRMPTTKWPSHVSQALVKYMQKIELNCVWADYVCDHYIRFLKAKRKEGAWVAPPNGLQHLADSDPPVGMHAAPCHGGVSI